MKAVFIGNDKSILSGVNADVAQRVRFYAQHFEQLSIVVFTLEKDKLAPIESGKLAVFPTCSTSRWNYFLDALEILAHLDYDLISTQDPFVAGLVGVLAKLLWHKKLNVQLNLDCFDTPYFRQENWQNYIFYWLGKFVLLFADSVRVVAKRMARGRKYFVASIPTDLKVFHQPPHTKVYNQIMMIGAYAPKNVPLFFSVARMFPQLRFVVVGPVDPKLGLEKIQPENVVLVGQKSHQEVRAIMAQSDIYLVTSNHEGMPISAVEAIAAGLPIVMTDVGMAGEIVVNGKIGGFISPVGDRDGLARAIEKLYHDKKLRRQLVLAGQENLFAHYTREQIMHQFVSGLKQTV